MSDVAANTLLTISMITRESLRILTNKLVFAKYITRKYDKAFAVGGAKIGNTLNLRLPPRYLGRVGQVLAVENSIETFVPLVLTTQAGCDLSFDTSDLTLKIDDFAKRFINPAVANVANRIDSDGLLLANQVFNVTGTPGTPLTTLDPALQAGAIMELVGSAPVDDRRTICLDSLSNARMVSSLSGLFNPATEISKQFRTGNMGEAVGFKWNKDQNVGSHLFGSGGGVPVVNGANQTGSLIVTNGWTPSTAVLNPGDIISFAGVNSVNPQSRIDTGLLATFVVGGVLGTPLVSDVGGNLTIPISPALIPQNPTPAQFATVTVSPANGAAVSLYASGVRGRQSLAFHEDAFALGSADLMLPKGVDMAGRISDEDIGMSMRMVRMYDIVNDVLPMRIDVLYGYVAPYPQLACLMYS